MKLRKKDHLQVECRKLWEQFDPIGVSSFDDDIDGEYDGYIPQTVRLIAAGADRTKLSSFVQNCVYVSMCLQRTPSRDEAIRKFVRKLSDFRDTSPLKKT